MTITTRQLFIFIFLLFSITILSNCKLEESRESQQIIIKLSSPVEISKTGRLLNKELKNDQDIIFINQLAAEYTGLLNHLFSQSKGSLNEEGELDIYITLTFINDLDTETIDTIITKLEQLDTVQTAYQAPIGEDAGMSLPKE